QICDDVAVMQHGRIVEQGPAAQVLTHPQQAYTKALLDAAPGRGWDFANFRPVAEAAEGYVIPGSCVSTRPGISRFRVRCFASPRNDGASFSFRSQPGLVPTPGKS